MLLLLLLIASCFHSMWKIIIIIIIIIIIMVHSAVRLQSNLTFAPRYLTGGLCTALPYRGTFHRATLPRDFPSRYLTAGLSTALPYRRTLHRATLLRDFTPSYLTSGLRFWGTGLLFSGGEKPLVGQMAQNPSHSETWN